MELLIGSPLQIKSPKNTYKINIEFMIGDADGTQYEFVNFNKTRFYSESEYREEVIRFITTLDAIIEKEHREGRGGYWNMKEMLDDYYSAFDIDRYLHYTGRKEWDGAERLKKSTISSLMFDIPSMNDYYSSFEDYEISYFDHEGVEHEVKIKK